MNKSIVFLCLFFISSILNILFAQNCVEDNLKTLGQISDVDAYLQKNKRRTSIIKDYALNKSDSLIKVIEDFHKNLDACNRELNGLENFTKFSKIQSSITLLKVLEMSGKIEHFQDLMTELDSIYPNLESLPIDFSYPNGAEEGKIKITNENAEIQYVVTLYLFQSAINIASHKKGDKTIAEDVTKDEYCDHEICGVFCFIFPFLILIR